MKKGLFFLCIAGIILAASSCEKDKETQDIITFEELVPDSTGYWNGSDGTGGFISGNATFNNTFTVWDGGFTSWTGFAYSNHTDVSTPGFGNLYSCFAGSGAGNSKIFAVVTEGEDLVFTHPERVDKISLANSTYAALSMRDGDDFAKKFGGADGTDPDYFHLIILGIDARGDTVGSVTMALADFTSDNSAEDYISNAWTEIPLGGFGYIKKLSFSFDSSDKGEWGINTPKFACIDNILGVLQ